MNSQKMIFSFSILGLLFFSIIVPIHAEVSTIETNDTFFMKGDVITFSGTVDEESNSLVTIVIYDSNNEFVLLTQALIESDETYQRTVNTAQKFNLEGIYNATAFITHIDEGVTILFDFSIDGSTISPSVKDSMLEECSSITPEIDDDSIPIEEIASVDVDEIEDTPIPVSSIASFVDPKKDPYYYLDRYYNEQKYQEWFDRNYPNQSIEEAVGYIPDELESIIKDILQEKIIDEPITNFVPKVEAISTIVDTVPVESDQNIAPMIFALGGLGILFGAVYGIKRKADTNYTEISKNRESIRGKMFGAIRSNSPLDVIRERLAKGEITIDDYNKLKRTLSRK